MNNSNDFEQWLKHEIAEQVLPDNHFSSSVLEQISQKTQLTASINRWCYLAIALVLVTLGIVAIVQILYPYTGAHPLFLNSFSTTSVTVFALSCVIWLFTHLMELLD
ncbi:hypothetical protein [Thalassotalea fusca]